MITRILENLVRDTLLTYGVTPDKVVIERPADKVHGDFSTNVALVHSKTLNTQPRALAEKLVLEMKEKSPEEVSRIEIAGPGFINFFITDSAIRTENARPLHKLETTRSGKNILVEHTSPNLFKPFHIGHLMNNIIGEFVARASERGGAMVTTMSFPSDVSLGIAKAMVILMRDKEEGKDALLLPDNEKIVAFGEAYRRGVAYFEEHPEEIGVAKEMAHMLYDKNSTSPTKASFEQAKKINNEYFLKTIKELGSRIDNTVYESEAGERGLEIVKENIGKVFTESEGAVVYIPDESRKDLHTQVFINSEGHPTYEAKDLGLIDIKFQKFNPDHSYFVTDAEQTSHFKVVLDAAEKLGGEWIRRVRESTHVPHGRMLFKGQKMSSRLGGVPLALDVIALVGEEVASRMGDRVQGLSDKERTELEKEIALSALRVSVLRSKPGVNINFDPETSLSFEGDSGPYLLYTHARTSSLLEKGKGQGYAPVFSAIPATVLERDLATFELVLGDAIENLAPQKLVTYLFEIAQEFNALYAKTQILTDDKTHSEHMLAIVARTKSVLKEGLWVLGIQAPDKM